MSTWSPVRLTALIAVACVFSTASAQEWAWAAQGGGTGPDFGDGVALDAGGNAYVVGHFQLTANFGAQTLVSEGGWDAFLVKYAPDGGALWALRLGGTGLEDRARGVAVAADGSVYVAGRFQGTATLGSFTLESAGSHDVFVAKVDPSGAVLWARRAGGAGSDFGFSVAMDDAGNAYVAGDFQQTATFGGDMLTSAGAYDVFVAKYAPNGDVIWARGAGGPGDDIGVRSDTDPAGNTFVAGRFEGTALFGGHTVTTAGGWDMYLARYSADGEALWARRAGSTLFDQALGVAVDGAEGAYVSGYFRGTADFGSHMLTSVGGADAFVARYSPAGEALWARRGGGAEDDWSYGLASDQTGHAYATGYFKSTADFGGETLISAGLEDVFVARYDPSGNVAYAEGAGGSAPDIGYDIAALNGSAVVIGYFRDFASFGSHVLSSTGGDDVFVAHFGAGGVGVEQGPAGTSLAVSPVRPNPATGRAAMELLARSPQRARSELFDALGRRVAVLFDGTIPAGTPQVVEFDAGALAPGIYLLRVVGEGNSLTRRLVVAR